MGKLILPGAYCVFPLQKFSRFLRYNHRREAVLMFTFFSTIKSANSALMPNALHT